MLLLLLLLLQCPLLLVMGLVVALLFLSLLFADLAAQGSSLVVQGCIWMHRGEIWLYRVILVSAVFEMMLAKLPSIKRASRSLAKTGFFFVFLCDFFGVLFQMVFLVLF